MKTVLDRLPADEKKRLLSEAASLILPNPRVGIAANEEVSDQAKSMLDDIRRHFRDREDSDEKAQDRTTSFLTDQLRTVNLEGANKSAVRSRLRDKGLLPIINYRLVINPAFEGLSECLQIRRSHIEEAVKQPTAMQRFEPSHHGLTSGNLPEFLIVTKRVKAPRHGESTLLVQGIIKDDQIIIGQSLRIYHEDIERPADPSPIALLRAFVNTYGAAFNIGEQTLSKFIFFDVVSWHGADYAEAYPRVEVSKIDPYVASNFLVRPNPLGAIEIGIMYTIRLTPYITDLKKRGLPVDDSNSSLARAAASQSPMVFY